MVSPENDKYIEMVGQGERAWGVIIQIEKKEVSVHIIGNKSASALYCVSLNWKKECAGSFNLIIEGAGVPVQ